MTDPLKNKEVVINFRQFGRLNSKGSKNSRKYTNCKKSLHLKSAFVNYSISKGGAPRFRKAPHISRKWREMSKINRLRFHVNELVSELGGRNFSMKIL